MKKLDYDRYVVLFSGGKDSIACLLHLLDNGVPREKIELMHHNVDGSHEEETFMDWECTTDYCRKFAQAFGLPIYFSWKEGGFRREMLRNNTRTAPIVFESEKGHLVQVGGTRGTGSTRMKFPQVSPDLSVRWCSAYLKIDVGATVIRHEPRFKNIRTLVISGERGEESKARAGYAIEEPDRADLRNGTKFTRLVDHWRPIRDWTEQQVWAIIEKYKILVHPAYRLGFSRVSCKFCIFGNKNQFKSAYEISPQQGERIIGYEQSFGCTIKRKESVRDLVNKGTSYDGLANEALKKLSISKVYTDPIFVDEWELPAGAYGESCGPS